MNLILAALLEQVWAMEPAALERVAEVIVRWSDGVRLTDEQIRAAVGDAPEVVAARRQAAAGGAGSVAVLPLYGVISHRAHMVQNISGPGGTSSEAFGRALRMAMADPQIGAILIDVDSPGGAVAGTPELSEQIYRARGQGKPIVAIANHQAASAAYYIASAADEFVVTPSGMVGSLGVLAVHQDDTAANEREGKRITIIHAGKYKAEGVGPLTDEARAHLQGIVDQAYATMLRAIARNRGESIETVRQDYGEGRMLTAEDALARGMVDRIATFDETLERLQNPRRRSRIAAATNAIRLAELR